MKKFLSSVAQDQLSAPSSFQGDFDARTPEAEAPELTAYRLPLTAYRLPLTAYRLLKEKGFKLLIFFLLITAGQFFSNVAYGQGCPCSVPTGAFVIGTCSTTTTNISTLTLPPPSTPLFIIGTLRIDQNSWLNGYTIYMNENARIRILADKLLDLNTCTILAACNYTWDRIQIDPSVALTPYLPGRLVMQNCSMSDAQNGIWALNGGVFTLSNNNFDKNIYHIRCHGDLWQMPNISSITNCRFTCSAPIIFTSSLPTNVIAQPSRTVACIDLLNIQNPVVGLTIGSSITPLDLNVFDNADFGIYANKASFWVKNGKFTNINRIPQVYSYGGQDQCAIFSGGYDSQGARIKIGGSAVNEKCTIENCANGIWVKSPHNRVIIANNVIKRISAYGVKLQNACDWYLVNPVHQILNNTFTDVGENVVPAPFSGNNNVIDCSNTPYTDLQIHNNTITSTAPGIICYEGCGIKVIETFASPNKYRKITYNQISGKRIGIKVEVDPLTISNNTVNLLPQLVQLTNTIGIDLGNQNYGVTKHNLIDFLINPPTNQSANVGIKILGGSNYGILCNTINKGGHHIRYESINTSTGAAAGHIGIKSNNMNTGSIGFYMPGFNDYVGPQGDMFIPSDNTWTGTFGGQPISGQLSSISTNASLSTFFVRQGLLPFDVFLMSPGSVGSNPIPINQIIPQSLYQCPSAEPVFIQVSGWREGDTLDGGSNREGFESIKVETWTPEDYNVMLNAFNIDGSADTTYKWQLSLQTLKKALNHPEWLDSIAGLNNWIQSLSTSCLYSIASYQNATENGDFELASSLMSTINPGIQVEQNFMNIYLTSREISQTGEVSESSYQTLLNIANQCIKEGGYIVSIARSLINLAVNEDTLTCLQVGGNERINNIHKDFNGFITYPNPVFANSLFIKKLQENTVDLITVELQSVSGKLQFVPFGKTDSEDIWEIDLNGISNGMYFVKAKWSDNQNSIEKVIVNH